MKYSEPRKVPPAPSELEWAKLYAGLMQVAEHVRMGLEYDGAPAGFMAVEHSLLSVIGYLQSSPGLMEAGAVTPLLKLAGALRDLNGGRAPELLASRPTRGKRPKETPEAHVIGFAARAYARLRLANVPKDEASKSVYSAMKKGKAAGWQNASVAKIVNWQKKCNSKQTGDVPEAAIQKYWDELPVNGLPPLEEAKALLKVLSEAKKRGLG